MRLLSLVFGSMQEDLKRTGFPTTDLLSRDYYLCLRKGVAIRLTYIMIQQLVFPRSTIFPLLRASAQNSHTRNEAAVLQGNSD